MLKVLLAVFVAGVVAAVAAIATEPVAAVGAPELNRINKGDRLDVRSRAGRSIHRGAPRSLERRLNERAAPPQPRAEVRIAWSGLPPAEAVAG